MRRRQVKNPASILNSWRKGDELSQDEALISRFETNPPSPAAGDNFGAHRHGQRWVDYCGRWVTLALSLVSLLFSALIIRLLVADGETLGDLSLPRLNGDAKICRTGSDRLHIYTAPKPFVGVDRVNQLRALGSWLALCPKPNVTFLGDGEGYEEVARLHGVQIETRVDTTFSGLPLFPSMLARTNESRSAVVVLINSDIMLFHDFSMVLSKVEAEFNKFFMIGARWDVEDLPNSPEEDRYTFQNRVVLHARRTGQLHTFGGVDMWAWNTGKGPLFEGIMPRFSNGRGKYDNWFTHEVIHAGFRDVVDVSEAVSLVHLKHDHHLVSDVEGSQNKAGFNRGYWSSGVQGKFELWINNFLANSHGTYRNQLGTILHAPYKITSCYENVPFCLSKRIRPNTCRCEYSPFVVESQSDAFVVSDSKSIFCGQEPASRGSDRDSGPYTLFPRGESSEAPDGYPSMDELVGMLSSKNMIVVSAVTSSDRESLKNFACNLQNLGISNYLLSALDREVFIEAVLHGLAAYEDYSSEIQRERSEASIARQSSGDCLWLASVASVLKTGHDVVYSDVRAHWIGNPLQYLEKIRGDLVLWSSAGAYESAETGVGGDLILFRSSPKVLRIIARILSRNETEPRSCEKLLFEAVCGPQGENQVDADKCFSKTANVSATFLPKNMFTKEGFLMPEEDGKHRPHDLFHFNPSRTIPSPNGFLEVDAVYFDKSTGLCLYNGIRGG
uniref:Nucleotide-diphospho-sugar transferase domain-containing protein n=1 Tax=Rhodosorus marinus TaxID=101924 RepID=A0A7S3E8Y1_9RHOD|mmetsp:Transcript_17906/g.71771  ORF Transcript_17906/g.71771 Transcript_17906/m.71771 type:complete len:728 (+) Transcript_17906:324-2507(+)